jgi:hypothetical protein
MRILTDVKILHNLLSYDTEEIKFLTLYERCEIHQNIARLMKRQKITFSDKLQSKLIEKVLEIRKHGWKYTPKKWVDNNGILTLVRA